MTETADRSATEARAVTMADKSRIRAFLIEDNLSEIQEALENGELSEDEELVLEQINTQLLNIQRAVNELKQNVNDGTTTQ